MPLIEAIVLTVLGLGAAKAVIVGALEQIESSRSARLSRLAQIRMVRAPGASGDETGDQTEW